jgi:cytochrome c553
MKYVAILLVALAGCRVSPPSATASDASRGNVELADLQQGRKLLLTKCGNCHRPPMPAEYHASEWPTKLDEMTARANLDEGQRHLIEEYLMTMASR